VVGCSDLESFYRPIHTSEPEGVVRFLNRTQSFRVLPKSSGYFFTQGQFFRPSFRFGPDYDDDQFGLFSMLHAVQRLGAIGDEKGKGKPHPKGKWPIDTVFGLIDSLGRKTELEPFMGKPKYLICDDMQTEAADFILADEVNKKVAFIHAKAQPKASIFSASNLQVVCGQGIKNAKYLAKHNELDSPPNHKTWDSKVWSLDGVVRKRIRRGSGTGPEIWSRIRGIIRDPYSTCEVWLVVGKTLSKQSLHDALTRKKPAPEAVQAAYLLFSAMTYIQSVGARLRVFCSP
jgi:hypothetical protein